MSYRFFAFLDLLGYKELIKKDLNNGSTALRDKLTAAFGALGHINEADVTIKAISDSIFLTLNNDDQGFLFFASVIRDLQVAFINSGLLLRGGIAFNQHFENGKVTYSPALLDAHQLETQHAFFPRVVVHDSVVAKLRNEDKLDMILNAGLLVKHSSTYQIHFIHHDNWHSLFEGLKNIARSDYVAIEKDPRVFAKHWYLQEYLSAHRPKNHRFKAYLSGWGR